ncbi:MAG TPA: 3-isopropylmalate dehydratase large subunit, partial [Dehalococcoidia bacterium]|nr:3-isopropylmalate dehydratase large subunit [Dehalococcoidia bacterium]
RAGLVAPDETTFSYLEGRRGSPVGSAWEQALDHWRSLATDEGAHFDTTVTLDGGDIEPCVTWGTNPAQSVPVSGRVPDPADATSEAAREQTERALRYMDLDAGTALADVSLDRV